MNTPAEPLEARFEAMTEDQLDRVLNLEQQAYALPWSRENFIDSIKSGYQAQCLLAGSTLLGYFVAMKGVDEVHLLNLTVAPDQQHRGWARGMLDALTIWARGQGAGSLWLEVRRGNQRALKVYEASGFCRVGARKDYYPAVQGQREDALVLSRVL